MLENFSEFDDLSLDELNARLFEIEDLIANCENHIKDEEYKMERYKIENARRQHNYIPCILELLKDMSEQNYLEEFYDNAKKQLQDKK